MYILIIFAYIIKIILGLSIIYWLDNLEKKNCKCSEDIKRSYIKNWWIILIIWNTIVFGNELINVDFRKNAVFNVMAFIVGFINLIFVFISLVYINNLRKIKCKCSKAFGRDLLYAYNIITIILLGFFLIFGLFFSLIYYKKK